MKLGLLSARELASSADHSKCVALLTTLSIISFEHSSLIFIHPIVISHSNSLPSLLDGLSLAH